MTFGNDCRDKNRKRYGLPMRFVPQRKHVKYTHQGKNTWSGINGSLSG